MSTVQPYPLCWQPVLQPRLWGGDYLARIFPEAAPSGRLGEAWLLSAHPTAVSVCANGAWAGQSLPAILCQHPSAYLGRPATGPFPVLVKLIDAAADLSVQVHPDDQLARSLGLGSGKTESWYVLEAAPRAAVVTGLSLTSPEAVRQAIASGELVQHLRLQPVQAGDLVHIPAGTVHALLRGVQVIEVQQSADVTYRLYDWDRLDEHGRPRQLHLEPALQAVNYPGEPPAGDQRRLLTWPLPHGQHLVQTPDYALDRLVVDQPLQLPSERPLILIVIGGCGELHSDSCRQPLRFGQTWLLPAGGATHWLTGQRLQLLVVAYSEVVG